MRIAHIVVFIATLIGSNAHAGWFAWVSDDLGSSNGWCPDAPTKAKAIAIAKDNCRKYSAAPCNVIKLATKEGGWFVVAASKTSMYLTYAQDSERDAQNWSLNRCMDKTSAGDECKVVLSVLRPGEIERQAVTPPSSLVQAKQDCRPTGNRLQCYANCNNGDCTITYENGCVRRIQVPPTFDGVLRQWKYEVPSC